jgi:hypothetical protein
MENFARHGRVSVYLLAREEARPIKPKNPLFCASRAWDQRAESGYMKNIEDQFQRIIAPIIQGKASTILLEQKPAVDRMYALWCARASYRDLDEQETELNGISGQALTKEQEENLEKNGYMFAREGGKWPARQFNGLRIQMFIDQYSPRVSPVRWGIITARSGEFIVPDIPSNMILPLSPSLALAGSAPDAAIDEKNLAEINRALSGGCLEYFFASDLSNAPGWTGVVHASPSLPQAKRHAV